MGIGEAGYYAGMIYYLSFWYKRCVFRNCWSLWPVDLPLPSDMNLHSALGTRMCHKHERVCSRQFSLCMTGTLPGAIGVCRFSCLFLMIFYLPYVIGSFSIRARPSTHLTTYRVDSFNLTPSQPTNWLDVIDGNSSSSFVDPSSSSPTNNSSLLLDWSHPDPGHGNLYLGLLTFFPIRCVLLESTRKSHRSSTSQSRS